MLATLRIVEVLNFGVVERTIVLFLSQKSDFRFFRMHCSRSRCRRCIRSGTSVVLVVVLTAVEAAAAA